VFTIETKTYSKPAKGKAEVTFDGERIKIGHWEPDRNPVIQARAQAGWLKSLLMETTGRHFPVHPVIVFPGWFVRSEGRPKRPIWVLNPKTVTGVRSCFLHQRPPFFNPTDAVPRRTAHFADAIAPRERLRQGGPRSAPGTGPVRRGRRRVLREDNGSFAGEYVFGGRTMRRVTLC
jgi:hypothetical protein